MPPLLLNLFHHDVLYPDGVIDVAAEQALLEAHDVHVFQFPCYWFSAPPLFKAWQDQILQYGWAFGPERRLEGKQWRIVTTLGGGDRDYSREGLARHTVDEILLPIRLTASYCGVEWLRPFCVFSVGDGITDEELAERARDFRELLARP